MYNFSYTNLELSVPPSTPTPISKESSTHTGGGQRSALCASLRLEWRRYNRACSRLLSGFARRSLRSRANQARDFSPMGSRPVSYSSIFKTKKDPFGSLFVLLAEDTGLEPAAFILYQ